MGAKQVRKGGSIPGSTLKQDAIFMKHETAVYQYCSQGETKSRQILPALHSQISDRAGDREKECTLPVFVTNAIT